MKKKIKMIIMKKIMLLCFVVLCTLSSCMKHVRVVELQSIKIRIDTSYQYKVIGIDSVVDELSTSIKMVKGDKITMHE